MRKRKKAAGDNKKEDTDSSTVAIESVYITAVVGAH